MKKLTLLVLLTCWSILVDAPKVSARAGDWKPKKVAVKTIEITLDTLTIYHPVTAQCDDTPLITASNARIDTARLRAGKVRWMALSRDLISHWGGKAKYGDKVIISSGDPAIDGTWTLHDTMNERFSRRGDLLFHQKVRTRGLWKKVKIKIIKS